jgi:hypothetical protein
VDLGRRRKSLRGDPKEKEGIIIFSRAACSNLQKGSHSALERGARGNIYLVDAGCGKKRGSACVVSGAKSRGGKGVV